MAVSELICFDVFELDLRARELRKHGVKIRLQDQPFLVLESLLETPGQVVTREELSKKIWPGDTFVDFDHGLHSAVRRLRDALNDSADNPRFIETLSRRGYRFIGQIRSQLEPPPPEPEAAETTPPAKLWTPAMKYLFAAVAAIGLLVFNFQGLKDWLGGAKPGHSFQSLAVLPLDNLSGDPAQAPWADEMTEELITEFSKLPNLKVVSRTSVMQYKTTQKTLPQIARELKVDAVMEGAVQFQNDRVRVTAQLVDGSTDEHIWGETYDRELSNVLLLQSELAQDIAKQINLHLTPQQQQRLRREAHPVNPDAYQDYLLGRYYWDKRTADGLSKAGQYFQQAIQKDPNYALAYSGLSDYYAFLTLIGGPEILPPKQAMSKARDAAVKALQLDVNSAEAHASMAHVLHNYDWDFSGAEREFQRAIELNPNYATAHHWYSHYLMQVGRTDESLREAKLAQELDPLSPFINNGLARQYYLARQYAQATAQCQLALQIDPGYLPAEIQLALSYEQSGSLAEAIAHLERVRAVAPTLPMAHALLAGVYSKAGRRADARKELSELKNIESTRYVARSWLAISYLAVGDLDNTFASLEQGYQDRSEQMLYMGVEPLVDPLRTDPRFILLLKRVGIRPVN